MSRRQRPAAKTLKATTALTPPAPAVQPPLADPAPAPAPAKTKARPAPAAAAPTPPAEPTVTLPASLAKTVGDVLGQLPSGQVADLYLVYRNTVNAQLQAAQQAKAP